MVFALQGKHNVLMMGLFAVVGFNLSLNPESIEVRRSIASAKAEGKVEMASELESIPMLSVNLSRILEEMTRQEEELHVTRNARAIRECKKDPADATKEICEIKHVEVEFKVTNTEGQNPFICRECAKGWHKVQLPGSVYDADRAKFQSNVDQKLAQKIDQMRDRDRTTERSERAQPNGRDRIERVTQDSCDQVDLAARLTCKSEYFDDIVASCDKTRLPCLNKIATYYAENLEVALKEALKSDSAPTRTTAATLRNKLFRIFPANNEIGNAIRVSLVEETLNSLKAAGQKAFDAAVAECRTTVRNIVEHRQCADAKLLQFMASQRSGFGDVSSAGATLAKSFDDKLKAWKPTGGPQIQGQATNIAGGGPRRQMPQVQNACPGPNCPRVDRFSVLPTPMGPNGQISQGYRPYTGQPGSGAAPGTAFQRPF